MKISLPNGADDDWLCVCGNTVLDSGFFPCNHLGEQVEPTDEDWITNWYVCAECGRMIDQATHEVIGFRADHSDA